MWSRRSILAGVGVSLFSLTTAGRLGSDRAGSDTTNPYLTDITVEELAGNVDADPQRERFIWVRFVPKRRLLAVRLEARVVEAADTELATSLDDDDDGWYVVARRVRIGHEHRGSELYLHAGESRQVPDADDRWLLQSRGFQPVTTDGEDFRGFKSGDTLRVVAVPYGADDGVVVSEHVIGQAD
jgi:hypothetical protein